MTGSVRNSCDVLLFSQDYEVCDPAGRDCIERNSAKVFGCNTTCTGIYAGVQLIAKQIEEEMGGEEDTNGNNDLGTARLMRRLADLEWDVKVMKNYAKEEWAQEEMSQEKHSELITEYREFGTNFEAHYDLMLDKLLKRFADLEGDMKLMKSSVGERGDELDKKKYMKLVAEYRKFKTSNVKHFRLNAAANASAFGEL